MTKGKAKGEAKGKAKAKEKVSAGGVKIAIGPPFRLHLKKEGDNFVCYLYGRINGMRIEQITRTSYSRSRNCDAIMDTILEEVNAGALTTKGQAIDRREELIGIDRAENALDIYALAESAIYGELAATAEHRAAG